MRTKCNTKMNKLTEIYTLRFSKSQAETLNKLKEYDVNISQFIRLAIKEKINRDWKSIKERKEKGKAPF
jgi:post-segregation antitoxin (ccd killing protein)